MAGRLGPGGVPALAEELPDLGGGSGCMRGRVAGRAAIWVGRAGSAHGRGGDTAADRHQVRLAPPVGGRSVVAVAELVLVRSGFRCGDADGVLRGAGRPLLLADVASGPEDDVVLVGEGEVVDVASVLVVRGRVALAVRVVVPAVGVDERAGVAGCRQLGAEPARRRDVVLVAAHQLGGPRTTPMSSGAGRA